MNITTSYEKSSENHMKLEIIECEECGGTGFSGQGAGYDSVCDNCGGKGELPN